jgi:predicted AAA+ superfamily ATPase
MFVLEEIAGWNYAVRSKMRIRQAPKRIFVDPSLAVAALKTTPRKLMLDMSAFGYVFENMCLRDLAVYAAATNSKLFHYRDNSNLEIDAVIEREDGSFCGFEVKVNPERIPEALTVLKRFRDKMTAAGAIPSGLCIITGGGAAHRRRDGIYIVPITSLRG